MTKALDRVSFDVAEGEFIAIISMAASFRHRYRPMPVEPPRARPLLPVKGGKSGTGFPHPSVFVGGHRRGGH